MGFACGTYKKNYLLPRSPSDIAIINRITTAQNIVTKIMYDCPVK